MPLDRHGRADGSMLEEMKTAYLGKLIRVDRANYSVGIVTYIKTYQDHFDFPSPGDSDPLVMRITKADGRADDYYVKPAKIEVWSGHAS